MKCKGWRDVSVYTYISVTHSYFTTSVTQPFLTHVPSLKTSVTHLFSFLPQTKGLHLFSCTRLNTPVLIILPRRRCLNTSATHTGLPPRGQQWMAPGYLIRHLQGCRCVRVPGVLQPKDTPAYTTARTRWVCWIKLLSLYSYISACSFVTAGLYVFNV